MEQSACERTPDSRVRVRRHSKEVMTGQDVPRTADESKAKFETDELCQSRSGRRAE